MDTHSLVPVTFRIGVSHWTQKPPFEFLPAELGIRRSASWRMRSSTRGPAGRPWTRRSAARHPRRGPRRGWRAALLLVQGRPAGHRVLLLMRHEALRRIPSSAGRNSKGGFWVQWLTPIRKVTGTRACQESGGQVQVSEMMRRGTRVIWRKLDCLISQSPDDAKNHPSERYLKPAPCSVPTL